MARAIWSGVISFGLVSVPVKLYSALRDRKVRLHMLSQDGHCRLRRKLYCPETGEEYDFQEAARGYEIAPDQYVLLKEDELEKIKAESGRAIELTDFVDLEEIDPIFYDRPYYLAPDEAGAKSYQLLLRAMTERGKVGMAKLVMRNREYLVALRPLGDVLGLETMRFAEDIRSPEKELDLPEAVELPDQELELAEKLIAALETDFEPARYHDEYRERLTELIEQKAEGEEIITQAPEEERRGEVVNLMDALKQSLEEVDAGSQKAKKSKKKDKKKTSKSKRKSA